MKNVRQQAFTMIEMVMVIAIIAVLALMMAPQMFDRTIRVQVAEGIKLADLARSGVTAYYATKAEMPASNDAAGVPPKDKIISNYVTGVQITDGAVTITFGNSVNSSIKDKHLTLRPAIVKDTPGVPPTWLCNNAAVPNGMTVMGVNATDIPAKWLPIDCR
jgi:type IV pilus assembly protein PilA